MEASDSARSLCSAQHIVRTNAIAKTVGVIEKGGSAERALVEKRQGMPVLPTVHGPEKCTAHSPTHS